MKPPPPELDGATVRLWSPIDSRHRKTAAVRLFADGNEQTTFAGVAIATYQQEKSGAYVFYCDLGWEVVNDSAYANLEEARAEAERQFEGIAATWEQS